ncbi:MAG TPA: hypothetical protein IGS52_11390 [Oscillatoriaceae cyanobacterium M33_DOE_052]|nr:hypothetical protein [Oscillatoriaceae cyanobacterium M33_DOE_052]
MGQRASADALGRGAFPKGSAARSSLLRPWGNVAVGDKCFWRTKPTA